MINATTQVGVGGIKSLAAQRAPMSMSSILEVSGLSSL